MIWVSAAALLLSLLALALSCQTARSTRVPYPQPRRHLGAKRKTDCQTTRQAARRR